MKFKIDFYNVYQQLIGQGKVPILCGGTGMYIHSLLQNQPFTAVPVNDPKVSVIIEGLKEAFA